MSQPPTRSKKAQFAHRLQRLAQSATLGDGGGPGADATAQREPALLDWEATDITATRELDRESQDWRRWLALSLLLRGAEVARDRAVKANAAAAAAGLPSSCVEHPQTKWHYTRAQSMLRGFAHKEERCGTRALHLRSAGVDWSQPQPCRCRACGRCLGAQQRRRAARLLDALRAHDPAEQSRKRRLRFLTLTERHQAGNDLSAQLERMQTAWRRWRASLNKRWGKFSHATVVEITKGKNGWHLHLHVLAWLPVFLPYKQLHHWWHLALGGVAGATGADVRGNVDVREVWRSFAAGARYLSKSAGWLSEYCAKALSLSYLAPPDRSHALQVLYGRRLVRASWRFWTPRRALHGCVVVSVQLLPRPSRWMVGTTKKRRGTFRLDQTGPPL